jgi:hypothetical protein
MPDKNIDEVIKKFQRQPEPDMCETAAVKSILDELAARHGISGIKRALGKINEYYNYRRGIGGDSELGISNLNDFLAKSGYRVQIKSGKESTLELLKGRIESADCSFPLISVSPEYFKEQNQRYEVTGEPSLEHILIILKVNDDVKFFDPYEKFLLRSSNIDEVSNSLSKPKLLRHWERTSQPRWVVWIERVSPRLEHYGGEFNAEE